jgi:AsmA-like C-terminal region
VVRTVVFAIVAGLGGAAVLYQRWTNPAATRRQVLEKLTAQFRDVHVSLESARLRLLGGIALYDLRLSRTGDADPADFLDVPSAVLYHDKEQLLDGRLVIRKIDLYRPRLRIARGPDGHWNLAQLFQPTPSTEPMPTIVIHQGTVVFEDRRDAADAPPLELRDVNLTLMNDPQPTLVFEGTAQSDMAGTVRFKGTRQRESDRTVMAVAAPSVRVDGALVQRLAAYSPDLAAHGRQLRGVAKLDADLVYDPGAETEWHYDVRCRLSEGAFSHALLPLPLDHVEASLHCVDGQVPTAELTARSGQTEVSVTAEEVNPSGGKTLDTWLSKLDCRVQHLRVTPKLFEALPQECKDIDEDFHPRGLAGVTFTFRRTAPGRWQKQLVVRAEDAEANYEKFPYPLEHISGTLEVDGTSEHDDVIKIDLAGRAAHQPVFLKGQILGERPCGVVLDIWGQNIPLDETLVRALPAKYQELARSFHPSGQGDFKAFIRRARGTPEFANHFVIDFHDAQMRYDVFPYQLENVKGVLDIRPEGWEFRGFRGTHHGGEFQTWGRCEPVDGGDRLEIHLKGKNVLLDPEMEAALEPEPELHHTWLVFAPGGRIDFQGTVERLPGRPSDVDLTVYPRGCSIQPRFFPYALHDLTGKVHYAQRRVDVENLVARHGDSALCLGSGIIYLKPGGGAWADLVNVQGRPLLPDADFVRALPESLQTACTALGLRDPLVLSTRLVIDSGPDPAEPPVIYWDGWAGLHAAALRTGVQLENVTGQVACRGRHNGHRLEGVVGNFIIKEATIFGTQHLEDIHSQVEVTPDAPEVLKFPGLFARYCGGEVYGPARVEFGPTLRYEMRLTASQVQLEVFARENHLAPNAELSGLASANLYLAGEGADVNTLKGSGNIAVPEGKMYNLPALLPLLKVLGLRPPDRTAFDELRASFDINGMRAHVNNLDLLGDAVSLRGAGDLNLDGSDINLDFNVDWARVPQMLPGDMKKIPHAISDQLLRIKMRGRIGDITCTKEPVPMLLDPFRKLLNGFRGADQPGEGSDALQPPGVQTSWWGQPGR